MRRRLRFQNLERRQLLAADFDFSFDPPAAIPAASSGLLSASAEGEQTDDLVAFAHSLGDAGVAFYGAEWCPACSQQKQLFEDGGDDLPFIEVTHPDRSLNQIGEQEGISVFPTWEFPDGHREEGILTLAQLSALSGVDIPQGDSPGFETIGDLTVQIGSPLHVPVDAYDPDGQPLTVNVTVDDPDLLEAVVTEGNRSFRIDMETYGDMVFELFEQRAPRTTGRVIELVEAAFYDDITFHRVIEAFVIQAGDPTGTGSSGSTLGRFDDEFHPDLQHNRDGVLSFAKAGDDTNNSQFFITDLALRYLDFNHGVFGQLVEGDEVREAISRHATDNANKPTVPIEIRTTEIFEDDENAVVMFKPSGNGTGSTKVTITVTDADGNAHSEVIDVDVQPDTVNSQPFLNELPSSVSSQVNTTAQLQLSSTDIEGDPVEYFASIQSTHDGTVEIDAATGLVTVYPADDFSGDLEVTAGVRPGPSVTGHSTYDRDTQSVTFRFVPAGPTVGSINLLASSDSGVLDIDNLTNQETLVFIVGGATDGASVELLTGDVVVGSGTADNHPIAIATDQLAQLGDGSYDIIASQTFDGTTSELARMTVVYDSTPPAPVTNSDEPRRRTGRVYSEDLESVEEGNGLRYSFLFAPRGATIVDETGVIAWTATEDQAGTHSFIVQLTDAAGNVRVQTFSVSVMSGPIVEIKPQFIDFEGNPITSLEVGEAFWIQLLAVDLRERVDRAGVFSAFADITFDHDLIRPATGAAITYHDPFTVAQNGTLEEGRIDELGAAANETVASFDEIHLIASVPMVAVAAGTVDVNTDPADDMESEVLLHRIDDEIPRDRIRHGDATLSITASLHRSLQPNDVNGDGETSASDALAVLNAINQAGGSFPVWSLSTDRLDSHMKLDVVPDGRISPLDALHVINGLNSGPPTFERELVDASESEFFAPSDRPMINRPMIEPASQRDEPTPALTAEACDLVWQNVDPATNSTLVDISDAAATHSGEASEISSIEVGIMAQVPGFSDE